MIEVYDNIEKAYENGILWGSETISITKEEINLLLQNKILAFPVNDEYMVFIQLDK